MTILENYLLDSYQKEPKKEKIEEISFIDLYSGIPVADYLLTKVFRLNYEF